MFRICNCFIGEMFSVPRHLNIFDIEGLLTRIWFSFFLQELSWTSPLISLWALKEQERPTWTATSVARPKLRPSKTLKSSTTTTIHTQWNTHLCSRYGGKSTCLYEQAEAHCDMHVLWLELNLRTQENVITPVFPGPSWSCCDLRWRSHPQESLQCWCGTHTGPEQDQCHRPGRQYALLLLHSTLMITVFFECTFIMYCIFTPHQSCVAVLLLRPINWLH